MNLAPTPLEVRGLALRRGSRLLFEGLGFELAPGQILHLRVERQTLRRLPDTGGALFTIRIWRAPLETLDDDPARLAAFAKAWRRATAEFRKYKGFASYDTLVEGFLRVRGESYSVNDE